MSRIDNKFIQAFDYLVPADQTLIAALVFKLATQEKRIIDMAKELGKILDNQKGQSLDNSNQYTE